MLGRWQYWHWPSSLWILSPSPEEGGREGGREEGGREGGREGGGREGGREGGGREGREGREGRWEREGRKELKSQGGVDKPLIPAPLLS